MISEYLEGVYLAVGSCFCTGVFCVWSAPHFARSTRQTLFAGLPLALEALRFATIKFADRDVFGHSLDELALYP
jgi:hypothetical protein